MIDTASRAVTSRIAMGGIPRDMAFSRDGRFLYVCLDSGTLEVVDWAWGGNQPTGLGVSPDGGFVCFSDFLDARLEVYAIAPAGAAAVRPPPGAKATVGVVPAASGR